jgi:NADP-dependent aldehyde dehydrogenase
VSALAAGCPVIVKGHPAHLGTGELVARALRRAVRRMEMPDGVFSYLPGEIATGTALVENPSIKAVGFTGSRRGGLALAAVAAGRREPIPVFAEMSSVNPVFLFPGALAKRAAEIAKGYAASMTLGAGQFCTSPGLVFVLEGADLTPFLDAVKTELGLHAPSAMLTPGIHAAFESGREGLAASKKVSTLAESVFETDLDSFLGDARLSQEVFGAASLVVRCKDVSELLRAAEHLEGQLTATLHLEVEDFSTAQALLPILERKAGRILANSWPTGVEVSHAMVHGGPYPATSNASSTSVGTLAIRRFLRPVCYQDLPAELMPPELQPASLNAITHIQDGKRQLS